MLIDQSARDDAGTPPAAALDNHPAVLRARRAFELFGGRAFLSPVEIERAGVMSVAKFY